MQVASVLLQAQQLQWNEIASVLESKHEKHPLRGHIAHFVYHLLLKVSTDVGHVLGQDSIAHFTTERPGVSRSLLTTYKLCISGHIWQP